MILKTCHPKKWNIPRKPKFVGKILCYILTELLIPLQVRKMDYNHLTKTCQ